MHCCANCFSDSFLNNHIPQVSQQMGTCDYCKSQTTALVEPAALIDYFESVCSIYTEANSENAMLMVSWLQKDWNIFAGLDTVIAQALLGEILNDGEVVRKNYVPRKVEGLIAVEKWSRFRDEITWNNRFFFDHELDLNRLATLFNDHLETDVPEFQGKLFRARIQDDDALIPLDKMGAPPSTISKNGRANPIGIPYFYAASTTETAIAETRPHPGDVLTVAQFNISDTLRLLNLQHPRKTISPFNVDEVELPDLRHDLEFLCHLERELAKPILPRVADLEYLPTQYLCEFIKNCNYDGVVFRSSISDGANITLFNDSKINGEALFQFVVTRLHYEQNQL